MHCLTSFDNWRVLNCFRCNFSPHLTNNTSVTFGQSKNITMDTTPSAFPLFRVSSIIGGVINHFSILDLKHKKMCSVSKNKQLHCSHKFIKHHKYQKLQKAETNVAHKTTHKKTKRRTSWTELCQITRHDMRRDSIGPVITIVGHFSETLFVR